LNSPPPRGQSQGGGFAAIFQAAGETYITRISCNSMITRFRQYIHYKRMIN
jgi:hypothetical protein